MLRRLTVVLAGCALLTAMPAEARFGKGGGSRGSSSSSSSHSHGSGPSGSSSGSSSSSGNGGGNYGGYGGYRSTSYRPHWGFGFGFVPAYRYGYYAYPAAGAVGVAAAEPEAPASNPIRITAGVEAQGYLTGFTLGVTAGVEGDRWGFNASGQNIRVRADDGTPGYDNLQVVTAHLTYALWSGEYGKLRVEGGADAVFAPQLIVVGPTFGLSTVIWVGGPFAIEGSLMATPYPFTQVDAKVGAALGVGPVGFRAGFRAQLLNDQGRVDGVAHQDLFLGPYVGVAVAL